MTKVAVVSFPGNNCEVESMRAVKRAGMDVLFFRWNDDRSKLAGVDGYFIPGGFSYEDRGRSGMVAARDPFMDFLRQEAASGKAVIGNCNGAQILVESGLIPLAEGLRMCLARNVAAGKAVGFLNEWIFITPTCAKDRCATSDWQGVMPLPIAHGEGRFVTKDKDLLAELRKNDQIAFSYCDAQGRVSDDPATTPNGSTLGIAGICNPAGNVVALMPHPERTQIGDPYFASMKRWIERGPKKSFPDVRLAPLEFSVGRRDAGKLEIFIDTLIVNNEEHTVEQAARRHLPALRLTQLKYLALEGREPGEILGAISLFNPNKEVAYIRRGGRVYKWESAEKREVEAADSPLHGGIRLLRKDEPDTGATGLGAGSETGVCYVCNGVGEKELLQKEVLNIFSNPHASTLHVLA